MRWKSILSLIIILGLIGVMINTESGQKYADWLKEKLGGIFSFLEMVPIIGKGEPFTVVLTVNVAEKNPFLGMTWKASDSELELSGMCESIKLGDMVRKRGRCDITAENGTGQFGIDPDGNVTISFDSGRIELDNWTVPRIEAKVAVFNEDSDFKISGLSKESIIFSSITGDIKKLTDEEMTGTETLKDKGLEIHDFAGTLKFEGSMWLVKLEGKTSAVKGEEFNWIKAGK